LSSSFETHCKALQGNHSEEARPVRADSSQFLHIPKCGGTTVESFLRIGFQGHRELSFGGPWGRLFNRATGALRADLIAIFRRPVERLFSQYRFELHAGSSAYSGASVAQRLLCNRGTGIAVHNIPCVPKVSFWAYGMDEGYRNQRGYDNLQFSYVRPARNATLRDVQQLLSSHFIMVGVTERMLEFQVLLAHMFGIAAARVTASVTNAGARSGPSAREVLDEDQYRMLEERNTLDMQLYAWADRRFAKFAHCFGEARLETQVRQARVRPAERRTYVPT
jgi:hypothetical protein